MNNGRIFGESYKQYFESIKGALAGKVVMHASLAGKVIILSEKKYDELVKKSK